MKHIGTARDFEVGDIFLDDDGDYCKITGIDEDEIDLFINFIFAGTLEDVEDEELDHDADCYTEDALTNMIREGRVMLVKSPNYKVNNWRRRIENEKTKEGESTTQET